MHRMFLPTPGTWRSGDDDWWLGKWPVQGVSGAEEVRAHSVPWGRPGPGQRAREQHSGVRARMPGDWHYHDTGKTHMAHCTYGTSKYWHHPLPTALRLSGWAAILTISRQTNNYSGGCQHCLVLLNPGHHYPPLHKSPAGWLIVPPWPWRGVSTVQASPLCPGLSLSLHRRPPPLACCSHRTGPIVTPEAGHWPHGGPGAGGRGGTGQMLARRNKSIVKTQIRHHSLSHQKIPEKLKFKMGFLNHLQTSFTYVCIYIFLESTYYWSLSIELILLSAAWEKSWTNQSCWWRLLQHFYFHMHSIFYPVSVSCIENFSFEVYLCGQNILYFILHEKCERGTKKAIFPEIKFYRAICWRGVARRGCDNTQDRVANCGKPGPTLPHCATLGVFVPNNFKINFQHWHNKF